MIDREVDKIYQTVPWEKLIKSLNLKENRKGRSSQFSPQGKLELMFLKAYSGQSDRKLYEYLNGNIQYQLFCGILLGPEKLTDYKIISKIRGELAKNLNIREVQDSLAKYWKPYLENPNIVLEDAACNESYMRMRKKPRKQTTKRTRGLLHLLNKLIEELDKIEDQHRINLHRPEEYYKKRRVIRKWCTGHNIITNFK